MNVFFDVDHTLVLPTAEANLLRPGAREAMQRIKDAGHGVYVWSAAGKPYVEKVVEIHGLSQWVDGCFDKDPRVQPAPDFVIDDDWYLVEKYGGHCVAQYKVVDESDQAFAEALERLAELGHL